MKNFTQSLIGAVVGVMCIGVASAQDVTTTSIDAPVAGATIYSNVGSAVSYTRDNVGAAPITSAQQVDSAVTITVLVNGVSVATAFRNSASDMAVNTPESSSLQTPPDWSMLGLASGTFELCIVTGSNLDMNQANDTICQTNTYESNPLPIDLGVTGLTITSPASTEYISGSGNGVLAYEAEFINNSTVDLPPNFAFPLEVEIDGDIISIPLSGPGVGWAAGTNSLFAGAAAQSPETPNPVGSYDFCARTTLAGDPDNTNNEFCTGITVILGPVPIGIEEEDAAAINNVFYSDRQLTVNMSNTSDLGETMFVVMNTAGQYVTSDIVNFSGQATSTNKMDLSNVAKGIYILGVYSDEQMIARKKFVVTQ